MTFYIWDQNNSGVVFVVDENVSHCVVIEADSFDQAEAKAFDFGIYYNGVEEGHDCGCCGDRWYGGRELDEGYLQDKTLDEYLQRMADKYCWEDPDIIVHYADGTKKTFTGRKRK